MSEEKLDHIEFESKYRVEADLLMSFKNLVQSLPDFEEFIYAEGPDEYYIKGDLFIRYRKEANKGNNSRAELTMKIKPDGAKNNIIREEFNVRVDGTPKETIVKFVTTLGFKYNFTIIKSCQIYRMKDATLVFYSVVDTTDGSVKKIDHFIEIEVLEETIHTMTEDDAWNVLVKYEKALYSLGINSQKRLRKSLIDIYKKD